MPDPSAIAIDVRDVQKDYHALRPLRVRALEVRDGESIVLLGFDRAAAEVLVNLITAATVPDAGEVRVFGRPTAAIQDADTWLFSLDCFGIVSDRAVLLDNMTVGDLARAVALARGKAVTEASGGITPESVRAVAATGVDLVSVGWITHSAPQLDVALDLDPPADAGLPATKD